ncbi:MAG: hypothetical protein MJK12_15545 [Colwellia sp.]|nr:hypothetical protein [Colwellia sp.]
MKYLFILYLLLSVSSCAVDKQLYFKSYEQNNSKVIIKEIERGTNYTLLEVDIIGGSAVGGSLVIVAAAVEIGTDLQKTHFTLINEYREGKLTYYKVFFTSDVNDDPSKVFPNEMSQKKIKQHRKNGYLSIETFSYIFKVAKSN